MVLFLIETAATVNCSVALKPLVKAGYLKQLMHCSSLVLNEAGCDNLHERLVLLTSHSPARKAVIDFATPNLVAYPGFFKKGGGGGGPYMIRVRNFFYHFRPLLGMHY